MACGTPVIAYPEGSVPEIIDASTGFLVNSTEEAVQAVARLEEIDRATIRKRFEERFSARRMAHDYVDIYRRLAEEASHGHTQPDPRLATPGQTPLRHGGRTGTS
jgi:glycosyltransferase involved in cell wall biosynthesis